MRTLKTAVEAWHCRDLIPRYLKQCAFDTALFKDLFYTGVAGVTFCSLGSF